MNTCNSTGSIGYAIDLRKKLVISVVLVLSCFIPGISNSAITVTGTLTADNHYALYTGNATGTYINMIGRNEYGPEGDDDGTNWASPETWSFIVNPGDYIYIFAWDVGPPEMVVATFSYSGNVLSTNTNDWLASITNLQNPWKSGDAPDPAALQSAIINAVWVTPIIVAGVTHNWPVPNQPAGEYIWGTNYLGGPDWNPLDYKPVLFRSAQPVGPIPEPETYALMLAGLGLIGGVVRRRKLLVA